MIYDVTMIGLRKGNLLSTSFQRPQEAEREVRMKARCILLVSLLLAVCLSSANAEERSGLNAFGPLHFRVAQATAEPTGGEQAPGAADEVFASAEEAARQSSNPLGGDFMIILNQCCGELIIGGKIALMLHNQINNKKKMQ